MTVYLVLSIDQDGNIENVEGVFSSYSIAKQFVEETESANDITFEIERHEVKTSV